MASFGEENSNAQIQHEEKLSRQEKWREGRQRSHKQNKFILSCNFHFSGQWSDRIWNHSLFLHTPTPPAQNHNFYLWIIY